jgi:hypothetical protein
MGTLLANQYVRAGVALGGLYAVTRFVKDERVRAACYGAMGVIVLRQVPVVNSVV